MPTEKKRTNTVLIVVLVMGAAVFLVLPMIGIMAAIAIPNFVVMQYRAKRAEVPANVDGIRTAQLAYHEAFGTFLPVGSEGEAMDQLQNNPKAGRPWAGFPEIGWSPDGDVRGVYWVTVDGDQLTVHGACDVDGDQEPAYYVATDNLSAELQTANDVY